MLINLVRQISCLPAYLHQNAMRGVIDEWRTKRPLINEVAEGRTTFETAVMPLVNLNSKKILCPKNFPFEEYARTANEACWMFNSILSFKDIRFVGGLRGGHNIGSDLKMPPQSGIFGGIKNLDERLKTADWVLANAKFLDKMFQKAR